jgi:hypothetical protein
MMVVEAIVEVKVEAPVSSAASSAEWEASCSGVGGVVGSGTPSAQCLDTVSLNPCGKGYIQIVLPVIAMGLAITAGSHRDIVLCYNGDGGSEKSNDRKPHID